MTILIDQCVPRRYLRLVADWGYSASLVSSHIPANSSDPNVIALAQKIDSVLLTADLDFSNILDYPPTNFAGIIVMRYQVQVEADIDLSLKTALEDLYRDDLRKTLVVITPGKYRIRR
ncbi:MAG: DUF5615 family PIN-like protein [Aggregatilineales bacterium]